MISRSSRLLHAALVVACGAGIVYGPVLAQSSLTLQLGQPGYDGKINLGHQDAPPVVGYRKVNVRPSSRGCDRWTQASTQPIHLRVPMNQARLVVTPSRGSYGLEKRNVSVGRAGPPR